MKKNIPYSLVPRLGPTDVTDCFFIPVADRGKQKSNV